MLLRRDISQKELLIYGVIWSSSVIYSIYCFATSSDHRFRHYDDIYSDFDQGWSFLSRKKDVGDSEWRLIKFLIKILTGWVITSLLISEALRQLKFFKILPLWQIIIGAAFMLTQFGIAAFGLIMLQPLVFAVVLTARNKIVIWITNGFILLLLVVYKSFAFDDGYIAMLGLNHHSSYIIVIGIFWMNLRCVSYCLDYIDSKLDHSNIKFLSYCLYLPQLLCGPFISFKDFQKSHQFAEDLLGRILTLVKNIGRFLFWFNFVELALHFIYVNAIAFHIEWIKSFDSWSLYGYGYTMGQFFHIKYVVIYGLVTTFAKFENIPVPTLPVCIGRIHLYSDMWKYFDVGLYNFLIRYIYIPIMKSYVKNRMLASLVCFIFVYVWHGTEYNILIWAILNYCGIIIEQFSNWSYNEYIQDSRLYGAIGPKWFRRITCVIASPLLAISAISNFYFFADAEIGFTFVFRLFTDKLYSTLNLWAIIYTLCQVSTEIRSRVNISKPKVT